MSLVRYESKDHVATITMDRRSAHNALNNELCTDLRAAWQRFHDSDDRVAVLASAEDDYYTVGADFNGLPDNMWHAVPGLGVALDLVLETQKPARGNTAGDGVRHGPCGMLGGEDGVPHDYRLISEGRPPRALRTKEVSIELRPGDCLEIRSSGGGGYGPPAERSAAARASDREQGLVTGDAPAEQGA